MSWALGREAPVKPTELNSCFKKGGNGYKALDNELKAICKWLMHLLLVYLVQGMVCCIPPLIGWWQPAHGTSDSSVYVHFTELPNFSHATSQIAGNLISELCCVKCQWACAAACCWHAGSPSFCYCCVYTPHTGRSHTYISDHCSAPTAAAAGAILQVPTCGTGPFPCR